MNQQSSHLQFDTTDMSSICTSKGIFLANIYAYSIQATFTGLSIAGTFTLEASNDPGDNGSGQGVSQPTTWTPVKDSDQIVAGTGNIMYDVTQLAYRWVRLVYTPVSGLGSLDAAIIQTKG